MIEEFLKWLDLLNQAGQLGPIATNQKLSNLYFFIYLLSIKRSYRFGAAFLACELVALFGVIPNFLPAPIFGLSFYSLYLVIWLSFTSSHILKTDNKNTLVTCVTMILFLLQMSWDSFENAYNKTFVWTHYEDIMLLIHISIVLSLYRDRFVFSSLVSNVKRIISRLRYNVYYSYLCYTTVKIKTTVCKE